MSSNRPLGDDSPPRRPSIPLQDFASPPVSDDRSRNSGGQHFGLLGQAPPAASPVFANLPGISTYWDQPYDSRSDDGVPPEDMAALQAALPPDFHQLAEDEPNPYATEPTFYDETAHHDYSESDTVPLTSRVDPTPRSLGALGHENAPRDSFQTVSDVDNGTTHHRDTLHPGQDLERGSASGSHRSYGMSLGVEDYRAYQRSSTSGAFLRAGSMVRAMSQRVVNLSGESEIPDQRASRHRSKSPSRSERQSREPSPSPLLDTSYHSQTAPTSTEKASERVYAKEVPPPRSRKRPNPLKGRTLGIFGPENHIRLLLCDLLVKPYTEPLILLLIVAQAVLLAVESGPDVFTEGNGRPERWGQRPIDWAMLGLFIVFTCELIVRIIVSGFILNAAEYSTIDRKRGVKAAIADQYRAVFQPERQKSVKTRRQLSTEPSAIARSFTTLMQGQQALPATFEEHQRFQLARRAFLRHGFNRLDFVSVVSFWIAFILGISGIEFQYHIYVFRMLSCLRILRLLALTNGTSIILRSLKKAAPLLLRVAFLIGFFWLLFAIIGVQSFKASFSRQCVWLDPMQPTNFSASFTNELQFCGGYLNNETGRTMPWVKMAFPDSLDSLVDGTGDGKGYLCPRGSICLELESPYSGTVNFDNIAQSLELVFVVMSANTFSTLMYYTMGSDYSFAALFFGAGVIFLTLWLVNLLIAVITSSFQVIRDESKSSAFTSEPDTVLLSSPEDEYRRQSTMQRVYDKTKIFWVVVIAFGLFSQGFRASDMSESTETFINVAEIVVTIILDFEILLRVAANWRGFYRSWQNLVDLALAIITSIILIPPIQGTRAYAWLTVFQILRTYRVVLAIPVTRKLILLVLGNVAGIANLMLFVFLMTFLAAILAAQLFRGEIPKYEDGELNKASFYNIYNSFLGMYTILTSESWTGILYTVTSHTTAHKTAWIGAIFLIGWFILAFFILINMFIAVIQENFDISEDEKRLEQIKAFLQRKELGGSSSTLALSTIFSFGKSRQRKDPLDYGPAMTEMLLKDAVVREFLDEVTDNGQDKNNEPHPPLRRGTTLIGDVKPGTLSKMWGNLVRRVTKREPNPFYSNIAFNNPNEVLDARQMAQQAVSATAARRKAQREYLTRYPTYNHSLFVFHPKNQLRRLCQRLVGPARGVERFDGVEPNKIAWYSFSAFIYTAIVAMVVIACITTPLYQKEYQEEHPNTALKWYVWTDLAFAIVFTLESAVKIIADGLFSTPNAYLRSSWGAIDAVVLITLWISVVTLLINDGHISRAVGAFKALRALRLLNVSNSARDTFHSLIIVGWWKLLAAAFISISLLIPFALYGLNLFNGLMISCNDSDGITVLNECFGEFDSVPFSDDWPLLAPRVASNSYLRFDDFTSSLLSLFTIASQEGWTDAAFAAMAITGKGMQPQDLVAEGNGLFFVIFNLLATVFILTLFISVFMRNYTEQTGVAFLTSEQRSWLELRKLLRQISPSKSSYSSANKSRWKRWCHRRAIEKRGKWYRSVTVVLVLHLLLLVLEFRNEPAWWSKCRSLIFLAFILFYMANIGIRIIGLGWSRFRRSSWDLFSLAVVFPAFCSTIVTLSVSNGRDTATQVHKIFLVAIVLLLIPRNDALDQLFKTAAASLTVIGSLLVTWLVLFLVFAIAMTQAFSLTRFGENGQSDINFRTVPKALIFLFRLSLGEAWNQMMEEYAAIEPPLCVEEDNFFQSDCGSKGWARFLFIAWNILSMYIFVNLFISLIYESFSYVYQRSSGVAAVDRDEIRRFKEAWRSVDPAGTGAISKEAFPRLLGELSGVFQMRIYDPEDSVRQILEDVRTDNRASYHTSLVATGGSGDVDVKKLNERLRQLDVVKIRERRRRYEIFYEEVLVGADPDRGITFTNVLMILAHYNIINDSKSLKLDEFLRRRARLQRVEESVRRKTVQAFFDTVYWTRKFKKHMHAKYAARMTMIPQLDIPDIFVDDGVREDEDTRQGSTAQAAPSSHHLSVDGGHAHHQSSGSRRESNTSQHPLSYPRASTSSSSPPMSPSGFSFDIREVSDLEPRSGEMRQQGDAVSPTQARDMLDDSIWLDSIRRSKTARRSDRGSYRYTDLG